jgi:uncharacterized membrane protein
LHPSLGADAIRYGLLVVGLTHLLGAMHHLLAARTLSQDLAETASPDHGLDTA